MVIRGLDPDPAQLHPDPQPCAVTQFGDGFVFYHCKNPNRQQKKVMKISSIFPNCYISWYLRLRRALVKYFDLLIRAFVHNKRIRHISLTHLYLFNQEHFGRKVKKKTQYEIEYYLCFNIL